MGELCNHVTMLTPINQAIVNSKNIKAQKYKALYKYKCILKKTTVDKNKCLNQDQSPCLYD